VCFFSLLSLFHLCFGLLQRPFSVHAQLRHAATQTFRIFFSSKASPYSCSFSGYHFMMHSAMCSLLFLSNTPFSFAFRLCCLFNKQHFMTYYLGPRFSAFQPQSHFYRGFSQSVPLHLHSTSTELSQWRCGSHPFRLSEVNGTDAPALPSVLSGIQPSAHSTCCN